MDATVISPEYRRMQEELHRNPDYGVASLQYAPLVAELMRRHGLREVLDYGAGKGRLGAELEWLLPWPVTINHYEPAVAKWAKRPEPCGFVTCIDVLEHIEPALLDNVLDDLARVTQGMGFFTVHTGPAAKVLPDGRNAHLIQQPPAWWLPQFLARFDLQQFSAMPYGFWVVVRASASATERTTGAH